MKGRAALLVAMIFTASTSLTAMVKAMLDVALVGRVGGSELAAFAFVFPVLFLLISVGNGVYIATAAAFSDRDRIVDGHVMRRPFVHSMLVSVMLGVVVAAVCVVFLPLAFGAMGAKGHDARLAAYFSIWLWTVPMMFVSANTFAIIRNLGYLKIASAITLVANIVGVSLSFALIPRDDGDAVWGIVGSAYSTLATSVLSTLISVGFVLWRSLPGGFGTLLSGLVEMARSILGIGLPVLLSNVLLFFFLSLTTRVFSGFGEDAVAAYGVNGRVEQVLLIFQSAFVTVAIPALSRKWSAGDAEGMRRYAGEIVGMMLALAFVLAIPVFLFRHQIADLADLTPEARVICLFYLCLVPITAGFQGMFMLSATILNLLRQPRKSLLWHAVNYGAVGMPLLLGASRIGDARACIVALSVAGIVCGLLAWRAIRSEIARSAKQARENRDLPAPARLEVSA